MTSSLDLDLADDSHTSQETRLAPGVYPSRGHALLVGTNQRSLTVLDMGGLATVAGVDVWDPDHLDALADRIRLVADRLRARATSGHWLAQAERVDTEDREPA